MSKEADRDRLKLGERIGNVIGIVFIVLVAIFFIDLQVNEDVFFTSDFGALGTVLFYGSLLFGIIPSLVRASTGRRNLGRFIDLFGSMLFILVAAYFLVTFPFDFTQLLNFLPESARDAFSWFTNDLVKLFLRIAIIISVISLAYNTVLFWSVHRELKRRSKER